MIQDRRESAIIEWLTRHYGLAGRLTRLAGQNLNYMLDADDSSRHVVKIVNASVAEESTRMEFELLEHVRGAGFDRDLPLVERSLRGAIEVKIDLPGAAGHVGRLLACVEGDVLDGLEAVSHSLLRDVGSSLGRLDRALEGFEHPAAHRGHRWELARAGSHRDKISSIADPARRSLVSWAFDLWGAVAGEFEHLPWQVIHGDANTENVLVRDGRVTGFVDFGDACFNPRICELAIALAYLMMDREDPVEAAAAVVASYAAEVELSAEELAVLFPLVCGRLAVTVSMASSRLSDDDADPNWFVSLEPAVRLLERLVEVGSGAFPAD